MNKYKLLLLSLYQHRDRERERLSGAKEKKNKQKEKKTRRNKNKSTGIHLHQTCARRCVMHFLKACGVCLRALPYINYYVRRAWRSNVWISCAATTHESIYFEQKLHDDDVVVVFYCSFSFPFRFLPAPGAFVVMWRRNSHRGESAHKYAFEFMCRKQRASESERDGRQNAKRWRRKSLQIASCRQHHRNTHSGLDFTQNSILIWTRCHRLYCRRHRLIKPYIPIPFLYMALAMRRNRLSFHFGSFRLSRFLSSFFLAISRMYWIESFVRSSFV